jgi:hypothetical protein
MSPLDEERKDAVPGTRPTPDVLKWLNECLATDGVQLLSARRLKRGGEREVWDCAFTLDVRPSTGILTIFKPGSLESVNTSLPPDEAASKCALAMAELPAHGIPTPYVLGQATAGRGAALLCEKVERKDWRSDARIEAARILSRIHNLQASSLSKPLQELVRISDPREYRTTGGEAPAPSSRTLVHGDYFSANIPIRSSPCQDSVAPIPDRDASVAIQPTCSTTEITIKYIEGDTP